MLCYCIADVVGTYKTIRKMRQTEHLQNYPTVILPFQQVSRHKALFKINFQAKMAQFGQNPIVSSGLFRLLRHIAIPDLQFRAVEETLR